MSTTAKQYPRIIAAARERVEAAGGIPALTLREIAATAELPLGSVRHVFASKDALLIALAEDVLDIARVRQQQAMAEANVLNRVMALLPQNDEARREVRVELRVGLHASDPTLSVPVRHAFGAVARESERLIRATCEQVVDAMSRDSDVIRRTFERAGLITLVEGLRFQTLRTSYDLETMFGVIRQHLTMVAHRR